MSARRRALLILTAALLLAAGTWIASSVIEATTLSVDTTEGAERLSVSTQLPAATCRKEFGGDFPWVRFACEPRLGEGGEAPP